jgi:hypothetical protein
MKAKYEQSIISILEDANRRHVKIKINNFLKTYSSPNIYSLVKYSKTNYSHLGLGTHYLLRL